MWAIRAFVGANGSGKTLAAVEKVAVESWREGRPVLSNFGLRPSALGFDDALAVPLTRWEDLLSFEHGAVILDEITTVASSRSSSRMPFELVATLNQLRKKDVTLAWTAPAWARADLVLREVTQAVTVCRGIMPDRYRRIDGPGSRWFPRIERGEDGRELRIGRAWRPNRLFIWRTFDAWNFDEWTYGKMNDLRPWAVDRRWIYRTPARHAYDTLEGVQLLAHLRQDSAGEADGSPGSRPPGRVPVNPRRRPLEAVSGDAG